LNLTFQLIRLTFPSRFEEGERIDIGETESTNSKPKVGVNEEGSVIPLTEINNKEEADVQEADLEGQEDVTARNGELELSSHYCSELKLLSLYSDELELPSHYNCITL